MESKEKLEERINDFIKVQLKKKGVVGVWGTQALDLKAFQGGQGQKVYKYPGVQIRIKYLRSLKNNPLQQDPFSELVKYLTTRLNDEFGNDVNRFLIYVEGRKT